MNLHGECHIFFSHLNYHLFQKCSDHLLMRKLVYLLILSYFTRISQSLDSYSFFRTHSSHLPWTLSYTHNYILNYIDLDFWVTLCFFLLGQIINLSNYSPVKYSHQGEKKLLFITFIWGRKLMNSSTKALLHYVAWSSKQNYNSPSHPISFFI